MRLPGFWHNKYKPSFRVRIVDVLDADPYQLDDLIARFALSLDPPTRAYKRSNGDGREIPDGERNDTLFRFACAQRARGASEAKLLAALRSENERCVPPLSEHELEQIARSAGSYPPGATEDPNTKDLPVIRIVTGRLHEVLLAMESALLAARVPLFQRGGELVTVNQLPATTLKGITRAENASILHPVSDRSMQVLLSRVAHYVRFDKREKKWLPTDPPMGYAGAYVANVGEWNVPAIAGIIEGPTLRPDGSLLSERGYDQGTGLFNAGGIECRPLTPNPRVRTPSQPSNS